MRRAAVVSNPETHVGDSLIRPGRRLVVAATLALAAGTSAGAFAGTAPVVDVTGGLIRGAVLSSSPEGAVFKSIPFAQPPVGSLRWREPQPVKPWKDIRDATRDAAACMQNPLGTGVFIRPLAKLYGAEYQPPRLAMSEDCLYLNVWTPHWPPKEAAAVMVFIHGGSNVMGSGAEGTYDSTALAKRGVVAVTINYRLGALGFFAHPELTRESPHHASGNYGLLDQIAALQWVHENIAQFGGDAGRVTIFGESAGAIDAGLLLCSPLARGLVQRAIMESGPVLSLAHHPAPLEQGERFGEKLALALELGRGAAIDKLRALPAETILQKAVSLARHDRDPGFVLDGWCLREAPAELFAQAMQLPVDIMIGNNGREMSAFRAMAAAEGHAMGPAAGGADSLKQTVKMFYGGSAPIVIALFAMNNVLGRTEASDGWLNDVVCACPEMAMAVLQASAGHRAYVYQFLRSIPGKGQKTLGSFHSLELPYAFGRLRQPEWSWLPFEEVDFQLAGAIQSYWTNFAKTGNPNGPHLLGWREFDARQENAMEFGKSGAVVLRARTRPVFCDLDPGDLRQRLSGSPTQRNAH